jgi:hypothetical protein
MSSLISQAAHLFHHHIQEIVFGIITISMVLAGPYINGTVKRMTKDMHWVVRFAVFVIVVCAGYGFITHFLYKTVKTWFLHMNNLTLVLVTVFSYLILAWFAKQQKEI